MTELTIPAYVSGTHNLIDAENIPKDAAQESSNFVTMDGRVVLVPGRELLGAAGSVGSSTGFHRSFKRNGASLFFEKRGTAIMYFDGSAWQNCITGLNATDEYTFANYASLAGAFTFINGPGGYWKVVNANPGSPIDVYDAAKNFKGFIIIDRGRTMLWNRDRDKTGIYGSWIDRQDSTVYTTVTAEAIGILGSTNYSGTLAFKGGGATRNAFGVVFKANTGAGLETFTDDGNGVLTSDKGGTGTINYATGAYNITFNAVTTGAVTSDYQWEDSNTHGITDFTHSATRLAGEGFQFPQDEGGDPILNVLIGQDGAYYSLKQRSAYVLSIDPDDAGATNEVYRKEMGLPFFRAAFPTNKGIFFINTVNATKPKMTILKRDKIGNTIEPVELFKHFRFEDYTYDSCSFASYDRWIVVFCRTADSLTNNRMLMCNIEANTVDVVAYSGKMGIQDGVNFYVADSITYSVYSTFSGFDDLGNAIDASWTGKNESGGSDYLKKVRRFRFKGKIDPDQAVGVYMDLDNAGFQKVGTIVGSAEYVDFSQAQAIGSNYIGQAQIGGDDIVNAYPYYMELKVKTGKFRVITVKLIPEGIGYFDFDQFTLWDILLFENRMPKGYRQKQNVSLDGTQVDQPPT